MNTTSGFFSESDLDDLQYSELYAEFIMENASKRIPNGDTLLDLQMEGYLWEEFLADLKSKMQWRMIVDRLEDARISGND